LIRLDLELDLRPHVTVKVLQQEVCMVLDAWVWTEVWTEESSDYGVVNLAPEFDRLLGIGAEDTWQEMMNSHLRIGPPRPIPRTLCVADSGFF
jgi:hypothetical protein